MEVSRQVASLMRTFDSSNRVEVMGCLEKISQQQKQCLRYHQLTLDKLDALLTVLSGPFEYIDISHSSQPSRVAPAANSMPPYSPNPDPEVGPATTTCQPSADDREVFFLRQKASSAKNFAVLLVKHYFEPHELEGRNVRGVGEPPLNVTKMELIRELVFKHYATAPSEREYLWRDCRKAVDTYLRKRKCDRSQ